MRFLSFASLGALLATAAAVPLKRDLYVNTVTEIDTVTEWATATVWVDADNVPATTVVSFSPATPTTTSTSTSTSTSSVITLAATSPKAEYTPAPITPATPPTTTSTTTSTSTSTSTTTPQAAVQTPVAQAPAQVQNPAPVPAQEATTTTQAAAVTTTSSSNSAQYTGQLTFYDVGLGSCGITNTNSDMVVAMAAGMMDKATMCGKTITINYGGKSHTATVVDTCPGCSGATLDLSPSLFDVFASQDQGRVSGATWSFN